MGKFGDRVIECSITLLSHSALGPSGFTAWNCCLSELLSLGCPVCCRLSVLPTECGLPRTDSPWRATLRFERTFVLRSVGRVVGGGVC